MYNNLIKTVDIMTRPFDILDKSKGKKVIIHLKNGMDVAGTLSAFDQHLNVWIEDAETRNNDGTKRLGNLLLRGDNIEWISPE